MASGYGLGGGKYPHFYSTALSVQYQLANPFDHIVTYLTHMGQVHHAAFPSGKNSLPAMLSTPTPTTFLEQRNAYQRWKTTMSAYITGKR